MNQGINQISPVYKYKQLFKKIEEGEDPEAENEGEGMEKYVIFYLDSNEGDQENQSEGTQNKEDKNKPDALNSQAIGPSKGFLLKF